MKLYILIALTTIFCCFNLSAQPTGGKVAGLVTTGQHGPAEHANLQISGTTLGTTTDKNGEYAIANVPVGSYTVVVSYIGYETLKQVIEVKAGEIISVSFQLKEGMGQLKEVTVTAQKKEESVQEVPASITVLGAKELRETRTWNTNDITALVPNMFVLSDGSMYMYYSARGISSYSYDPVIQTYVDDVPLFSTLSLYSQLFDVNRMEVLRGPQGTLYGRNAIGGVVTIVSNKPTNILRGRGEVSFGNYGQQRYSLAIASPIIKNKLFISANGTYNKRNGYTTNTNLNTKVDNNNAVNGSASLKYMPTDKWSFTLNSKIDRYNSTGIGIAATYEDAREHPYTIQHSSDPELTRTLVNSSFVSKYTGKNVVFTSVTAVNTVKLKYGGIYDVDYTPADAYSYSYKKYGAPDRERNFYQELRLNSIDKEGAKFKWIVGGVFYKIRVNRRYESNTGIDSGDPDAPYTTITDAAENHHGFAGFGQVTYSPVSKFDITAGLRYDNEEKNLTQHTEYVKEPGEPIVNPAQKYSGNFDALSPKVSLAYKFTDKTMLYGSYARGFRAGGLNWGVTTKEYVTFGPEHSNNFEIGSKTTLLNDRLRFNAALYWLTYDDIQAYNYFGLNVFEGGNVNAGSATSKGVESEITFLPIKGLQVEESVGYTHATYNDFTLYNFDVEGNVNYKNKFTQYTPNVTNMTAIQYSLPIQTGKQTLALTLRAEYRYIGKVYYSFDNATTSPAYSLLNSSVGVSANFWEIKFWGRNLADEVYLTSVYPWGGASFGSPRMYGITLVGKF